MSPGGGRDRLTILAGFVLGGWHVADSAAEPAVIEPVDPLEGGQFEVLVPKRALRRSRISETALCRERIEVHGRTEAVTERCLLIPRLAPASLPRSAVRDDGSAFQAGGLPQ